MRACFFFYLFLIQFNPCVSQNKHLDSLLKIYTKDSIKVSSTLLNTIGGEYYIRYDLEGYNTALKFHQLALDVSRKNKDAKSIAVSYRLIAAVYDAVNMNLDTAVIYYQNYLNYQLQIKDTIRIIDGYNNLLVMNFKLKRLPEQIAIANKLYIYLKANRSIDNVKYKNMLCIFFAQQHMLEKAEELLTEIDAEKASKEDSENFRNYYYAKHFLLLAQKKHIEAIEFLNPILKKANLTSDSINITVFLGEHYEAIEDYKNAFAMLKIETKLLVKYANDADRNKIAETAAFYLNDKKEEERLFFIEKEASERKIKEYIILVTILISLVALLITYYSIKTRKKNKILKIQKNELHTLNDEKTLYLKEIHHRVKNNLQFVSSMLDLQIHDIKDEKIKLAFKEMQMRIESMTTVHKSLYEGDLINQVNLQLYFENLFSTIYSSFNFLHKKIRFQPQSVGVFLNIDYALPLGLIVNELITNSLKHAFFEKSEGDIKIVLIEKEKGLFEFRYSDNGTGLSVTENVDQAPSPSSFGLKLVKLMVKKLKGTLTIENKTNELTFLFDFKIKH
jgi:two-component sensor histidine kinase